MRKYIIIVILVILVVSTAFLGIAYTIDRNRMRNNLPVVFSTWGYSYSPPLDVDETQNDIPTEIGNNTAVIHHTQVENVGVLDRFIANTNAYAKNRIEDSARIITYTIEGDEVITDIKYILPKDNDYTRIGEYEITRDNTRDEFSTKEITTNKYSGEVYDIQKVENNGYIYVKLVKTDGNGTNLDDEVFICAYPKNSDISNYFFGTIIQATTSYIIVEPNEGEEIRKTADKIYINLDKESDGIYTVGTNVKITYSGDIEETYPAKIKAEKIEIKSVDDFKLIFESDNSKKVNTIVAKDEIANLRYNIYSYGGNAYIEINDKKIELREALLNNKITADEIVKKANSDLNLAIIQGDMYKDGGSMIYKYNGYTLLKCHTLDGNRDLYIGNTEMTINDIYIK